MKTQLIIALFGLLSATASQAHLEKGTYSGITNNAENCTVEVLDVYFEKNLKHPLHERARVVFQGNEFTLSHPGLVNEQTGTVGFNHDQLTGFLGMPGGSMAGILKMEHSETKDGPSAFILVVDHARDASKDAVVHCNELKN